MTDPINEKLSALTGILKESRKSWREATVELPVTIPKFKQIKVNAIPGLGPRAGPKKAKEGLNELMHSLLQGLSTNEGQGHWADRIVEYVDFEAFEKVSGVKLTIKRTPHSEELANCISNYRSHLRYVVETDITNTSLPLARALIEHREAREKQTQDVKARKEKAEEAIMRVRLAALDALPDIFAGGASSLTLPVLTWPSDKAQPVTTTLWANHY
jgi:hypothetical protein